MGGKKVWLLPKVSGLRRRWMVNTLIAVIALAVVCTLVITAVFATHYYTRMESDLRYRARTATSYLAALPRADIGQYYDDCVAFVQSYTDEASVVLQFIDNQGALIATSLGTRSMGSPETQEIQEASSSRGISSFVGKDSYQNCHVIAVSAPLIYSSGEVIGVFRFLVPTAGMNRQILAIALYALLAMSLMAALVLVSSHFRIRSIMVPLAQIVDKSRMIANGSYGIQIQTTYSDEVGELAHTINDLSMKISQNEKVQTEFISNLSHELRTPLTAITGWSETLLSGDSLDQGTRRGVRIIHREAARLTEMVIDLLDFTRIQDGRMILNMEVADIRSEFEDTVFMYRSRLAQDGITLEYSESTEDIPEITCDPKRMRQVFLNILDNAAKHGGEGKRIGTDIRCVDDQIVVRIRDYGTGIPLDELPLVTRKFFKGSSKARGSGIGLAVCDEIVQMHGGTLTLENALGGGTLVTVRLPISQ